MSELYTGALPVNVELYIDALQRCADQSNLIYPASQRTVGVVKGRKFFKVVLLDNSKISSVHAFIDAKTQDLIKAASYKAPQKDLKGNLAVRYRLAEKTELEKVVSILESNPSSLNGGYLYAS